MSIAQAAPMTCDASISLFKNAKAWFPVQEIQPDAASTKLIFSCRSLADTSKLAKVATSEAS